MKSLENVLKPIQHCPDKHFAMIVGVDVQFQGKLALYVRNFPLCGSSLRSHVLHTKYVSIRNMYFLCFFL